MKAFKKWFETICDYRKNCDPTDQDAGCDVCEGHRRQGWKGALEWLCGNLDYSEGDKRIKDLIDDELKDKDNV